MLTLQLFVEQEQELGSAAIAGALGVPDDGASGFEIGRAETGASLYVERREDGSWLARIPTMRAPWSARDLLPALAEAGRSLGGFFAPEGARPDAAPDLVAEWDAQHAADVRGLVTTCMESGAPPPPFARRAVLERVHAALVDVAAPTPPAHPHLVHALDAANGSETRFCVRLPREHARFWIPALDGVLFDPNARDDGNEEPAFYPLSALPGAPAGGRLALERDEALAALKDAYGEPLGRLRVVTPVEVVDAESFPTSS